MTQLQPHRASFPWSSGHWGPTSSHKPALLNTPALLHATAPVSQVAWPLQQVEVDSKHRMLQSPVDKDPSLGTVRGFPLAPSHPRLPPGLLATLQGSRSRSGGWMILKQAPTAPGSWVHCAKSKALHGSLKQGCTMVFQCSNAFKIVKLFPKFKCGE